MADSANNPKQQNQPRGIGAAAIEGAKEGERQSVNPDEVAGSLARPAPGMSEQPEPAPSSTNQYTGITGGLHEDQEDEEQEWRRAGGDAPGGDDETAGGDAGRSAAP